MTHKLPSDLAKPAQRALLNAGIFDLVQLSGKTENEVSDLHGIGPTALRQLREALANEGLAFRKVN